MVNLFRERSVANVFWVIMLSILLHLPFFVHPPQVVPANGNGALSPFLYALPELPGVVIMVLYHVIVLLQAFRLNYMLNELRMFQKQALTTAMCYVLFTSLFEQWNHITPALLCNSLIIWLFHKMTQLKSSSKSRSIIYNIGFIAGTAVLLYHPSMTLILVCFIAIAVLRPFHLNEWFILLIGILTPFYFLLFLLFLCNDINSIWLYIPEWGTSFRLPPDLRPVIATLITLAVVLLAGIYSWRASASRMLIQVRKEWAVLLFMLLVLIPAMFISKDAGYEAGLLSMVPGAALASHIFLNPRKAWLPNIFFWTLAAFSIYNNWK